MSHPEQQYLDLLGELLSAGERRVGRNGGVQTLFARQLRFDLAAGFPALTTKRLHLKSVIHELLWFLRGETNVRSLQAAGVTIWDEWADEHGDLGPVYGAQWRHWRGEDGRVYDQIAMLIDGLRRDPTSRRHIVSSWRVDAVASMALPPCHLLFQCFVSADDRLSCQVYQRSADVFLGVPFNIASYALLTHLLAAQCDLGVGELIWTGGDVHLYANHQAQAQQQCARVPKPLPTVQLLRRPPRIEDYRYEDIVVADYAPHPTITAPISV